MLYLLRVATDIFLDKSRTQLWVRLFLWGERCIFWSKNLEISGGWR